MYIEYENNASGVALSKYLKNTLIALKLLNFAKCMT